ncbi:MAG: alpha/beta hydrolase, partial [Saprospiraceae bacterium]|nr:alpha/beta hydrolase [Saprospiraceae bacterium]
RYEWVRGLNFWVEQQGKGTPLVLVSGGPGTSHHYFHPHFQAATKFSEIIFYDLRGVGLSDYVAGEEGYSIDQAVEDLDALREKLGYEKWAVLGLSFGGVLTQLYALKYPERIAGMVLLSSALPMSLDIGLGARQYDFLSEAERKRIGEIYSIAGQRVAPVHSDQIDPALQRKMLFNAFMNGDWKRRHIKRWTEEDIAMYARYEFVHDKGYYQAMLQDYFEYDLKGLFKSCPVPTLIIEGKWDLAYGEQKAGMMFEQFPNAHQELWENTGHLAFEDEPERFMKALRKFLSNLPEVPSAQIQKWKNTFQPKDYRKPNQLQREFLRRR